MKKKWGIFIGVLVILAIWIGEGRNVYSLPNGKYLTVWKTYGDICYIIPDKYYGLTKPSENYIITSNDNVIDCFWSDELPNNIIVVGNYFEIFNKSDEIKILKYSSDKIKFEKILYLPDAKKFSDVKKNVTAVTIFTKGPYMTDLNGKRIN